MLQYKLVSLLEPNLDRWPVVTDCIDMMTHKSGATSMFLCSIYLWFTCSFDLSKLSVKRIDRPFCFWIWLTKVRLLMSLPVVEMKGQETALVVYVWVYVLTESLIEDTAFIIIIIIWYNSTNKIKEYDLTIYLKDGLLLSTSCLPKLGEKSPFP